MLGARGGGTSVPRLSPPMLPPARGASPRGARRPRGGPAGSRARARAASPRCRPATGTGPTRLRRSPSPVECAHEHHSSSSARRERHVEQSTLLGDAPGRPGGRDRDERVAQADHEDGRPLEPLRPVERAEHDGVAPASVGRGHGGGRSWCKTPALVGASRLLAVDVARGTELVAGVAPGDALAIEGGADQAQLRVGARQHGDVLPAASGSMRQPDLGGDPVRLGLLVVVGRGPGGPARRAAGSAGSPSLASRTDGGGADDLGRRPVVVVEPQDPGARHERREIGQEGGVRPVPAVDGLVGVPDGEEVAVVAAQQCEQSELRGVHVLHLVDEEVAIPPADGLRERLDRSPRCRRSGGGDRRGRAARGGPCAPRRRRRGRRRPMPWTRRWCAFASRS